MGTLDDIIEQEYENDDGEIIAKLEMEIMLRDIAIRELYDAVLVHYNTAEDGSLTQIAADKYNDFYEELTKDDYENL